MTQLRERSHVILWILLVFFILSMSVGGLVGGADLVDIITGGKNTNRYVGWIDGQGVTHQQFINERNNQIGLLRRNGQQIDARATLSASNNAWNKIVEETIINKKIKELGLEAHPDEIYDFLALTPPPAFQRDLMSAGAFIDTSGNFDNKAYNNAINTNTIPEELNPLLINWENYLRSDYLPRRKLINLYNSLGSVSEQEILAEYMNQNQNCTIDYLYAETNNIADSLIIIDDDELIKFYEREKEDRYSLNERKVLQYVMWEIPTEMKFDTLKLADYQDSLMTEALIFADEADITSFTEALDSVKVTLDTLNVHEDYTNNSGLPSKMGPGRSIIRFAFDNNEQDISDPIQLQNGIGIFNIIGTKEAEFRSFEEVKESIKRSMMRDKKKEYAKNILNNISQSDSWQDISASNSLINYKEAIEGTINSNFDAIGTSNELRGALRGLSIGNISTVIETFNTACLIKVIDKVDIDTDDYNDSRDNIKSQLTNRKKSSGYSDWLKDMKTSLNIEDYRSKSY